MFVPSTLVPDFVLPSPSMESYNIGIHCVHATQSQPTGGFKNHVRLASHLQLILQVGLSSDSGGCSKNIVEMNLDLQGEYIDIDLHLTLQVGLSSDSGGCSKNIVEMNLDLQGEYIDIDLHLTLQIGLSSDNGGCSKNIVEMADVCSLDSGS